MFKSDQNMYTIKGLCRHHMPLVADMHKGIDPKRSLTEYQLQVGHLPNFRRIFQLEDEKASRDMLLLLHTYARWLKFGMSVFKPTEDLFASLVLTDPTNVEPELVCPPFPTFFVVLPPKTFFSTGADGGKDEELKMVMINHVKTIPKELRDGPISLKDAVNERHVELVNFMLVGPTVFLVDSIPVLGKSDWSTEDWLTANQPKTMWMNVEQDDRDLFTRLAFRRFYINFCLFITERGKGQREQTYTTRSAKRRNKRKNRTGRMEPATWVIGREVKIEKELISGAKDYINSGRSPNSGWKIKKRSIVRGHWRNQACGSGRSERKKIWIEPFWRGPEAGTKVQHIYTTDKS